MKAITPSRIKIAISLLGALFISFFLIDSLFVEKTFIPHWDSLNNRVAEFKNEIANTGAKLTTLFITLNVEQMIPTQAPTPIPLIPTPSPIASPPPVVYPTTVPTSPSNQSPSPTFSLFPTPTVKPKPTATKTPTRSPVPATATPLPVKPTAPAATSTPKPPPQNDPPGLPTFPNPYSQKWYGNGSLACYTQSRFIQVYANGVTPDSCRYNVKAAVEGQLASVKLLGKSVTVHKKTLPAFQAVAAKLEQYKKDATHYDFPSHKNYEIRNAGAYVFRCNVNASTSDKFDTCSAGCVLSPHAFGIGIDINYDTNQNGSTNYDMPKEIYETFEYYGFRWGGNYPKIGSKIDPMHFEYMVQLCDGV